MTGQRAPLDPTVELTDRIKTLEARLGELARSMSVQRWADGTFGGTTNGTTSALVVTHNLPWTPTKVLVQPATPNGGSTNVRFVSANVTAISSTTFTIGRCVSQDGSLLTATAVTGFWVAFR